MFSTGFMSFDVLLCLRIMITNLFCVHDFYAISSFIYKVLSVNTSAIVIVFGDFKL